MGPYRRGHRSLPPARRYPLGGCFQFEEGQLRLWVEGLELEVPFPEEGTLEHKLWPWELRHLPGNRRVINLPQVWTLVGLSCVPEYEWKGRAHTYSSMHSFPVNRVRRWRRYPDGEWQEGYPVEAYFAAHAFLSDPEATVSQVAALYGASEVLTSLCLWELYQEGYRQAKRPKPEPRPRPKPRELPII